MLCLMTRGCYFLLPWLETLWLWCRSWCHGCHPLLPGLISNAIVFPELIVSSTPSKLPVLSRCENIFERNKSCPARPTMTKFKGALQRDLPCQRKIYGIWTPNSIFTVNNDDNPLEAGYLIFINQTRIVNNGIQIDR